MNLKKTVFLTLALTYSLTAVGCGGSVNSPGGDAASALSAPGGGLESLDGGGGLEPIEALEGEGEFIEEGGEEFVEEGGEEFVEEAPAEEFVEEGGEEFVEEEAPAEEFVEEELPAEELPGEEGDTLGEIPELGGDELGEDSDTLGEIPELGGDDNPFETGGGDESGYIAEGNFKIDQDRFNQWQAVNLVSDGSTLYVAAVDMKTPSKGTVISMDASGGSWKDLGGGLVSKFSLGAFGYDMSKTITGVALDSSGTLVVNDSTSGLFQMATPDFDISEKPAELNNANDIVEINGSYYVSTAIGILKYDSSLSASTVLGPVVPTGGIGKDNNGNLLAVVGSAIQKIDGSGNANNLISDLSSPIDVTTDGEGNIFVLESDKVQFYNAAGESQGSFGMGDMTAPKAIFADSSGAVYVADFGTGHTDSQVVKFSKSN